MTDIIFALTYSYFIVELIFGDLFNDAAVISAPLATENLRLEKKASHILALRCHQRMTLDQQNARTVLINNFWLLYAHNKYLHT